MKESISAVANVVTRKFSEGNQITPSGSTSVLCQLCNAPGHSLQNCKVKAGAERVMWRLEKIQPTAGSSSSSAVTKSAHAVEEDLGSHMDTWENRDDLVDTIRSEAAMLVMELQSKQSTNQDVVMTMDKIGKLKEEYPSIVTPIVDHVLMVDEGDSSACFHSSHLFPRLGMVCETILDSGASVCIFKDQILFGEDYVTCTNRFVRTAN